MPDYLKHFEVELKLGGYNAKTIKTYQKFVKEYLNFKADDPTKLDIFNIKEFILEKYDKGNSRQTIDLYLNALKFFYKEIVGVDQDLRIKLPKRTKKPPVHLTYHEAIQLFKLIDNKKHRWICQLSYGSGLRISEILSLKVGDFDFDKKVILVKGEKGKVMRKTMLPYKIMSELNHYFEGLKGDTFAFESQMGGRLSERGIQRVFASASIAAGIKKDATFHSLRHGFAVRLLQKGIGVKHVQKLLGLKTSRAVNEYKQLIDFSSTDVPSPLDIL